MMINRQRLLDRFLRYVQVATTADPESSNYPSSDGQLELGRVLLAELKDMGLSDSEQDDHGLVWATVPASVPSPPGGELPTVLFNAHLDTSPDASGTDVKPQVIENYAGGDIQLLSGDVISVAECGELKDLVGHCLITTDGNTLLGGDDKAGVAAIMELANYLVEHPEVPHGPVRVVFTCDEEIGKGASHMDLGKANAQAGYTLDGSGRGEIEQENFSADHIVITALGHVIHPAIAKDKMKNALRAISLVLAELPVDTMSPETTDGREGFIHPYQIEGNVSEASVKCLLRSFDTAQLDHYAETLDKATKKISSLLPGIEFKIERARQYRNMADFLKPFPQIAEMAKQAHAKLGTTPELGAIRGGTDGAQFSEMGLPTPNLSVGQHNIHSVLEFASLDEMEYAVKHAITMLELWQDHARS